MRARWVLPIVLCAGLLASLGATQLDGARGAGLPQRHLVPVGHVGDEIEYDVTDRESNWEGGELKETVTVKRMGFRVDAVEDIPDPVGHLRPTIRIVVVEEGRFAEHHPDQRIAYHVDLATRALLRLDVLNDPVAGRSGYYGYWPPRFASAPGGLYWAVSWTNLTDVRYQGRLLAVGDDLAAQAWPAQGASWQLAGATESWVKQWVAAEAVVDGHTSLEVRTERFMRANGGNHSFAADDWVPVDFPYLVLGNWTFTGSSGSATPPGRLNTVSHLAAFRPGAGPAIPWAADPHSWDILLEDPTAERAPARLGAPDDGAHPDLAFPLGRALAAIDADPTLVGFSQWRASHDGVQLYGAGMLKTLVHDQFYTPVVGEAPTLTWTLAYGEPKGSLWCVEATLEPTSGWYHQRDCGAARLTGDWALKDADRERLHRPVTFAGAREKWRQIQPEFGGHEPDFIQWGLVLARRDTDQTAVFTGWPNAMVGFGFGWSSQKETLGQRPILTEPLNGGGIAIDARSGGAFWELGMTEVRPLTLGVLPARPSEANVVPGRPTTAPAAVVGPLLAPVVASSAAALLLIAYFWPAIKWTGAHWAAWVAGYSRVQASESLRNEVRQRLHDAILADPGVTPPELKKRVAAPWSTVVYHLLVLERHGLVRSLVKGRHKHFFPGLRGAPGNDVAHMAPVGAAELAVLRNERSRAILEAVALSPGILRADLARIAGISIQGLDWHVHRLQEAGLLAADREDGRIRYFPKGHGAMLTPALVVGKPTSAAT